MSWFLFLPACFALNAAPGPNNLTAFVNGARLGVGPALLAGTGRLPAFMVLIGLTVVGLGPALESSTLALTVIRYAGAAYLIYVGYRMWTAPAPAFDGVTGAPLREHARREFLVAIGNPKAIAIFTAFFPQFLDMSQAVKPQLLAMGAAFLALEVVALASYVIAGRILRGALRGTGGFRILGKGVGGVLAASGITMALERA